MGSSSYTPRHGSSKDGRRGVSKLVTAVRRPVVGGALAVGMVSTIGATVAFGDPAHLDTASAAISASSSSSESSQAPTDDPTTEDTASLAEDRRETNVSRSGAREQERRDAQEKKAERAAERKKAERKKKAKAQRAAKAERAAKAAEAEREAEEQRENDEKPVSERDFTREQLAEVRKDPKPYAVELMRERGWGDEEWGCLDQLWIGESDWEWDATNSSSGAYGIPQALPAKKMATAGSDWKTNPITQMVWGMEYIEQSYGSPCEAKEFWDSKDPHWY